VHGYNYDGTTDSNKIAKSLAAQTTWSASTNTGAIGNDLSSNNRSGFSALPGGCRYATTGGFHFIGDAGYWWSATANGASYAYRRDLGSFGSPLYRSYYNKTFGLSVRLVRN